MTFFNHSSLSPPFKLNSFLAQEVIRAFHKTIQITTGDFVSYQWLLSFSHQVSPLHFNRSLSPRHPIPSASSEFAPHIVALHLMEDSEFHPVQCQRRRRLLVIMINIEFQFYFWSNIWATAMPPTDRHPKSVKDKKYNKSAFVSYYETNDDAGLAKHPEVLLNSWPKMSVCRCFLTPRGTQADHELTLI